MQFQNKYNRFTPAKVINEKHINLHCIARHTPCSYQLPHWRHTYREEIRNSKPTGTGTLHQEEVIAPYTEQIICADYGK